VAASAQQQQQPSAPATPKPPASVAPSAQPSAAEEEEAEAAAEAGHDNGYAGAEADEQGLTAPGLGDFGDDLTVEDSHFGNTSASLAASRQL
jgi:hypothetical protein